MYEAEIKQIAMAQSAEVNVVTDRTKFGVKDLFSFAALDKADRIITDSEPAPELLEAFALASVEVVV
jgi:DeoR/GlpR family transcriptional regulator of sugar metabolism